MCGKYVVANMSFVQTVRLFFSVRSVVVMTCSIRNAIGLEQCKM